MTHWFTSWFSLSFSIWHSISCLLCLVAEKIGRKNVRKELESVVLWNFMCWWLLHCFGCMSNVFSLMGFMNSSFSLRPLLPIVCDSLIYVLVCSVVLYLTFYFLLTLFGCWEKEEQEGKIRAVECRVVKFMCWWHFIGFGCMDDNDFSRMDFKNYCFSLLPLWSLCVKWFTFWFT